MKELCLIKFLKDYCHKIKSWVKNSKHILSQFIIYIMIFISLFYTLNLYKLNKNALIVLSVLGTILFLISYSFKNLKLIKQIIIIILSYFISLLIYSKLNDSQDISFMIEEILIVTRILIVVFIIIIILEPKYEKVDKLPKLMEQRLRDLERLKEYIEKFNILGLNGRWGTGKSLLIDHLKNDMNDKYYFIEIDVLATNIDDLQYILISELSNLLKDKGIFSIYSPKLKNFFSTNKILKDIRNQLFYDDTIYSDMIGGLKNELKLLKKPTIIIYEDLDRINNHDVIKKILGISEKLSTDKIKIIYQYHKENMIEIDKSLNEEYLEKYIQYDVNLSDVKLLDLIIYKLNINKEYNKYIEFIDIHKALNERSLSLEQVEIIITVDFEKHLYNMRRVKDFLIESKFHIEKECNVMNVNNELIKNTILVFFVIKTFISDIYEKLKIGETLLDTLIFKYENEIYTLEELVRKDIKFIENKILSSENNEEYYKENNYYLWILLSLDYYILGIDYKDVFKESVEVNDRQSSIENEDYTDLSRRNYNDKINSMFWYLLSAGNSKYTRLEEAASKLKNNVIIGEDKEQWNINYEQHLKELESSDKTIFRWGISRLVQTFKSFSIIEVSEDEWIKLIEFTSTNYEHFREMVYISYEMISSFNYLPLDNININKKVGEVILEAGIKGNLDKDNRLLKFLKKFYSNWVGMTGFDYIETFIRTSYDLSKKEDQFSLRDILKGHTVNLETYREDNVLDIINIDIEIDLNIKVTNKIIDLIETKRSQQIKRKIETKVSLSEKKEIKKLEKLYTEDENKFDTEVNTLYKENKVNKIEIENLLKRLKCKDE